MRRLTTIVVLALGLLAAAATAEMRQEGMLRVFLDGSFTPRSLPRDRLAPVAVEIEGRISTADGSQPPPLRRLAISLNRGGRIFTRGLPICRAAVLQSTNPEAALARCRGALVGRGDLQTSFAFPDGETIAGDGSILVFNGRVEGKPALLLHLYGTAPTPATFVLPVRIGHGGKGEFGIVLRTRIPKLAGGLGSITGIALRIDRKYRFRGKGRSYLSASCSAPAGFPEAVFPLLKGTFSFEGHQELDATLVRDCRVR
jgi:hypothetical protein